MSHAPQQYVTHISLYIYQSNDYSGVIMHDLHQRNGDYKDTKNDNHFLQKKINKAFHSAALCIL